MNTDTGTAARAAILQAAADHDPSRAHRDELRAIAQRRESLDQAREDLDRIQAAAVAAARAAGISWGTIGESLGMTRQGAQQRYGTTR